METRTRTFLVVLLLVMQVALTVILWLLPTLGLAAAQTFTIVLGSDLLVFAAIVHLYRISPRED
jgi:hypothetical protein